MRKPKTRDEAFVVVKYRATPSDAREPIKPPFIRRESAGYMVASFPCTTVRTMAKFIPWIVGMERRERNDNMNFRFPYVSIERRLANATARNMLPIDATPWASTSHVPPLAI